MNKNNIGSNVQERVHKSIEPEPMYIKNDLGHKAYRDLGSMIKQQRLKSTLHTEDVDNRTNERAAGGY